MIGTVESDPMKKVISSASTLKRRASSATTTTGASCVWPARAIAKPSAEPCRPDQQTGSVRLTEKDGVGSFDDIQQMELDLTGPANSILVMKKALWNFHCLR